MRINLNLASQPYEDARQFYTYWGTILGIVLLLTAAMALYAWNSLRESRAINAQLAGQRAKVQELERERAKAQAILNEPKNVPVKERSEFLNNALAQKQFSWTQIFMDLEKLVPRRASILSIGPKITPERQLALQLSVAAQERADALDLVRQLEKSQQFIRPELTREQRQRSQQDDSQDDVRFEIVTLYQPPAGPAAGAAKTPAASADGSAATAAQGGE